jgi:predicted nucleotide-binding protein (sugar kinase/HSP70/actin superfamily)
MELISKLSSYGAEVITPEFIDEDILESKSESIHKRMFWTFGKRVICSTLHFIERGDVDGIIYLMSFGCGVDALISDLSERYVRRGGNIPFLLLTIDEHSGEAGFNTRLEAFIDMVIWRMKNEGNISAHG